MYSSTGYKEERWGLGSICPPCCLMQGADQAIHKSLNHREKKKEWCLREGPPKQNLVFVPCFKTAPNAANKFLTIITSELVWSRHHCAREQTLWQSPFWLGWSRSLQNSVTFQSLICRLTQFCSSFASCWTERLYTGWSEIIYLEFTLVFIFCKSFLFCRLASLRDWTMSFHKIKSDLVRY